MFSTNKREIKNLLKCLSFVIGTPYLKRDLYTPISAPTYKRSFKVAALFSVIACCILILGFGHVAKFGSKVKMVASLGTTVKFIVFVNCRIQHVSEYKVREVVYFINQMEIMEAGFFKRKSNYS